MTKADFLVRKQLGKLGEEEDEEKEPATERRREYIGLKLDLGEMSRSPDTPQPWLWR